MCGRYGALDSERITQFARDLGAKGFEIQQDDDVRPTNQVPVIEAGMETLRVRWGIQPAWAKKILINAQGETVAEKRTFAAAFREHRCLIPLDCWYEWRDEGGSRKQGCRRTRAAHGGAFGHRIPDDRAPLRCSRCHVGVVSAPRGPSGISNESRLAGCVAASGV